MRTLVVLAVALAGAVGCNEPSQVPPPPPAALSISFVSPNTVRPDVASAVRIIGTGFQAGATVTIDGAAAPATETTSTAISVTAPPHPVGAVDVVVTNPGGQSARLAAGLSYLFPPPDLRTLAITGNVALGSVGETSQFTATATYADGTTANVTNLTTWSVGPPSLATITANGLLTARGLGLGSISARHPIAGPSLFRSVQIVVTPPGTIVVGGRIREPGASSLPGVRVEHPASGQSATTNTNGEFSFAGVSNTRLLLSRADFEPSEVDAVGNEYANIPLQRIIRIGTEASVSRILAPNDMQYFVSPGVLCHPCRLVRVVTETAGTLQVRVKWTDSNPTINIWANGRLFPGSDAVREVVADIAVGAGELLMYYGRIPPSAEFGDHTSVTITTGAVTSGATLPGARLFIRP